MNTKILVSAFVIITALAVIACSKNSYNTKPTIKIKSLNGNVFENESVLVMELQITDKEGDVTNKLFLNRLRLNQFPNSNRKVDSFYFEVPDAPSSPDGTIQLNLKYQDYLVDAISPRSNENDTIAFKMALTDKAGNTSDTVITEPIVVIR